MIDEEMTVRMFGYTSDMLSSGSHKKIVIMCDECGMYRIINKRGYHDLCHKCSNKIYNSGSKNHFFGKKHSDETRKKMSEVQKKREPPSEETRKKISEAHKGNKHTLGRKLSNEHKLKISEALKGNKYNLGRKLSNEHKLKISESGKGKIVSDETRKKMSEAQKNKSEEHRKNLSEALKGRTFSEETKKKMSIIAQKRAANPMDRIKRSCSKRGIPYDEWEGFVKDKPYCPRFNNACRESNREKYGRRCFLSGKPESENITKNGKVHKLSVHHVDMNKMQGCDGNRWRLVPLSKKYHGLAHSELWEARITWLLNNVWG